MPTDMIDALQYGVSEITKRFLQNKSMSTDKAGHSTLFKDEYISFTKQTWEEMVKATLDEIEKQSFGVTPVVMHPDMFEHWIRMEKEKIEEEKNMATYKTSRGDPNGDLYFLNPDIYNHAGYNSEWLDFIMESTKTPATRNDNSSPPQSTQTIVDDTSSEQQEGWIRQTLLDLEDVVGAHPLLEKVLRARLMNLPGYSYVNPT